MKAETLIKQQEPDFLRPTIFHEDWWLELASAGRAQVAEITENGCVVARMPYMVTGGSPWSRRIVMPLMTHFLGPSVEEGAGSPHTRLTRRIELTRELVTRLPKALSVKIKCHAGIDETIGFQMEGFSTGVQYTYVLTPRSPQEAWEGMHKKRRSVIRGAEKECVVERLADAQEFMRLYDDNLRAAGKDSILDSAQSARLIAETLRRGRGAIYATRSSGELAAAIFCVWDKNTSYYLMSTRGPSAHSGAVSLLVYEAIKDAMARGLVFDFDGLPDVGAVVFFTTFGGNVAPRFIVTREAAPMKLYRAVRSVLGKESTYA